MYLIGMTRLRFPVLFLTFMAILAVVGAGSAGFARASDAVAQLAKSDAASDDPLKAASVSLVESRTAYDDLVRKVEASARDDARLVELRAEAEQIINSVSAISSDMKSRLDTVRGRITELGEPPQAGQPAEAAVVSEERNRLIAERGQINAVSGEADTVLSDTRKLSNSITAIRRSLFSDTLFRRTALTAILPSEVGKAFMNEMEVASAGVSAWAVSVWNAKRLQLLSAVFLSLAAALFLRLASARFFGTYLSRSSYPGEPDYLRRLSVGFWSTMTRTLLLVAFLAVSILLLHSFNIVDPDVLPLVERFVGFLALIYFVWRLTKAIFAPSRPGWRLVPVSEKGARTLSWFVIAMAVVNGLDYLLSGLSELLNAPVVLTVAKSFIASVIVGLLLIVISFLRPLEKTDDEGAATGRPWPRWVATLLRLSGFLLIVASLAGYIGLARFVSTQIVLTGAVLATMYIGVLSGRAIAAQGVLGSTVAGKFLRERFGLGDIALDQAGLFVGLAIYICAAAFGIPIILLSWGFKPGDMEQWLYRILTGFTIGNISISLVGIVGGILVFAVGYALTRWFQNWLDGSVMARGHVDAGVRNSVKTGVGYTGIAAAVIFGVSSAGFNLSSLALVASALSVGIGFGLQNIVSNFVSGLILLVERPFKVGDWVVTGTTEGTVKRMSVRATEVETFRGQSIIVPNSQFINNSVGNWTHRNRIARSEIQVGVSYDADPRQVMSILLELVRKQSLVLRTPEPSVEFLRFGDSSLDFELRFHLADLSDGLGVRNELRVQILERFRQEGIDIPFPQRNLNVEVRGGSPALVTALLEDEDGGGSSSPARSKDAGKADDSVAKTSSRKSS